MLIRMEVYSSRSDLPELRMTGTDENTDPIQIHNIDGLGPVKANINTTPYAATDGESYTGSSVGKRNIVLTLGLNPDWDTQSVSSLRKILYVYFMTKRWVNLRFFSDDLPDVEISGYVESFEPNIFSKDPEVQISIICPQPDFVSVDATFITGEVTHGVPAVLEYQIDYVGTIDTGFELRVDNDDAVGSAGGVIGVRNQAPEDQAFGVSAVVDSDHYFKMSTVPGKKFVQLIDVSDGTIENKLRDVTLGGWPVLKPGENNFAVWSPLTLSPPQLWTMTYFNRFGGI